MEIAEHLVMDDLVALGDELCIAEHLVVILACVNGDLPVTTDVKFVANGVDSLVADVDEGLLMKHYVLFVHEYEHVD